jgi:AcrR family transcriptional regulator
MSTVDEPRRRGRPPSGGREAILDAALELLGDEGVAKLTSREIAARAGVSDASVYYHFGDRAGLLKAVFARGLKPLTHLADMDPRTDLGTVLTSALASLETFYDDVLVVLMAAQADADIALALTVYAEEHDLGPHRGVALLSAYLAGRQAVGSVNPDADTEAIAMIVIDIAYARSSRRLMLRPDERLPSAERVLAPIRAMLEPPTA